MVHQVYLQSDFSFSFDCSDSVNGKRCSTGDGTWIMNAAAADAAAAYITRTMVTTEVVVFQNKINSPAREYRADGVCEQHMRMALKIWQQKRIPNK